MRFRKVVAIALILVCVVFGTVTGLMLIDRTKFPHVDVEGFLERIRIRFALGEGFNKQDRKCEHQQNSSFQGQFLLTSKIGLLGFSSASV
jgi:hypothetical protein